MFMRNRANPLNITCQNGYDNTVQLLLCNGADLNLCNVNGASPLYIACQSGHDSTEQLLLRNEEEVIYLCQNDDDREKETDRQRERAR